MGILILAGKKVHEDKHDKKNVVNLEKQGEI